MSPLAMVSCSRCSKLKMPGPSLPSAFSPLTIEQEERKDKHKMSDSILTNDFIIYITVKLWKILSCLLLRDTLYSPARRFASRDLVNLVDYFRLRRDCAHASMALLSTIGTPKEK